MAKFKDYKEYLIVRDNQEIPGSVYEAKTTTTSGFLEFKPRDMVTQRKYDAMSPAWEGIESTNKAVASGVYALGTAEKKAKVPVQQPTFFETIISFFFPTR